MSKSRDTWWIDTYDQIALSYTDAQPFDALRKLTEEAYLTAVAEEKLPHPVFDLEQHAAQMFEVNVQPVRARRSNRLVKDLDVLIGNAIPEDEFYIDGLLSQAHRIGDGTDGALRFWTVEHWTIWGDKRRRQAVEVAAAAAQATASSDLLIQMMHDKHVKYSGDLFPSPAKKLP